MEQKPRPKISNTLLGQAVAGAGAGIFQVYSGGIVLDTIKTRLQSGKTLKQSLWRVSTQRIDDVVHRLGARRGESAATIRLRMLLRSNLYAGHAVTAMGRFPYLFLNLGTYQQTERLLGFDPRRKTIGQEITCITAAAAASSLSITATECPKIFAQISIKDEHGKPYTVGGIVRRFGLLRLLQGYDATFVREWVFGLAFLGGPGLGRSLRESYVLPNLETSALARALDGRELIVVSMVTGFACGFITNPPDQLKTRIQTGKSKHIVEAFLAQLKQPRGFRALLGYSALTRALFTMHGVTALNFSRAWVEKGVTAVADGLSGAE